MINTTITPIKAIEAANLLNVKIITIHKAVGRGILTKVPSTTEHTMLIKEQVMLFKDKSQIRRSLLNNDELEKWIYYENLGEKSFEISTSDINYNDLTKVLENAIASFSNMSDDEKKTFTSTALILLVIIVLALGISWYLSNKEEIDEKLSNLSFNKIIDSDTSEYLVHELQQELQSLGSNVDTDTIIETVLKKVS